MYMVSFSSRMAKPYSKFSLFLIIWYGLYQAVHLIVNVLALVNFSSGSVSFPALPPPSGWSPQTIHFFTAMAVVDSVNAVLSLVFIYGYVKRTRWRFWLGTLTLTVSMYAAILFNYGTLASGAWLENLFQYLFLNIAFFPVVILFCLFGIWAVSSKSTWK